MTAIVRGVVREGRVVPDTPLPEGASVEVRVVGSPAVPEELQEEFAAWGRVRDRALALAEGPADGGAAHETR